MAAGAEIICVGTELLLGDILDTNSQFLSRELAGMGINVFYRSTVGDNPERLASVVKTAASRSDLIILTGGLGPTKDDLTVRTVCETMGVPLVLSEAALERIRAYFARAGKELTENNLSQAMVPQGGEVFLNERGTAPGSAFTKNGVTFLFLPGPPTEMEHMFTRSVKPFLQPFCGGVIRSRFVNIYGIGESAVDELTAELQKSENPTVAPYAKDGECLLRVTAKADDASQCEALCDGIIDQIKDILGENVYSTDGGTLQQAVVDLLKEKHLTAATAESCTAGYISKRITEIAGASEVFHCGVSTYSNEMKTKLLGVEPRLFETVGAVSREVAVQMARGVRLLSGSDIGLSITGIAGPTSDGSGKPVGLCYIALSDKNGEICIKSRKSGRQDREYIRYCSASEALNLLRKYLISYPNALTADGAGESYHERRQ